MSGVAAVRVALVASAELTALVPAERIMAGVLPQGTALPALSMMRVSGTDRNVPSPGAKRHVAERVQVTVHATTYPEQDSLLKAVRKAAADTMPDVEGLTAVTIHTDSTGPDFMNEIASIYLGSQDFRVTYSEER